MKDIIEQNDKRAWNAGGLTRRNFLQTTLTTGTGLMLSGLVHGQPPGQGAPAPTGHGALAGKKPADALNIAIIGAGAQGRVLTDAMLKIPGIKFKAVCDIWEYSRLYTSRYIGKFGHTVNVYEDYREMLAKEKDLTAVVIATPDWMHAEHSIACMEAGLHVYCEKEMSNSLEKAQAMVTTARRTGRLLQIGHQRRSNPRYQHAVGNIIQTNRLLGRVTAANGQWNRGRSDDLGWPKKYEIDAATLTRYGYDSMHQFRNWRWFRKYGGGPIVDLGSHQIDIFNWVFKAHPASVTASGGVDYYKTHEWYDGVMCNYVYETPEGMARVFYQVLTTTSNGGYYETFMGEDGTLIISENAKKTEVMREPHAPEWDKWANSGVLKKAPAQPVEQPSPNVVVDVRESAELDSWLLPMDLIKPYHQCHLENFFDAIRYGTPLNCPPEIGYETAVTVLAVNQAIEQDKKIEFKPEDFIIS